MAGDKGGQQLVPKSPREATKLHLLRAQVNEEVWAVTIST